MATMTLPSENRTTESSMGEIEESSLLEAAEPIGPRIILVQKQAIQLQ